MTRLIMSSPCWPQLLCVWWWTLIVFLSHENALILNLDYVHDKKYYKLGCYYYSVYKLFPIFLPMLASLSMRVMTVSFSSCMLVIIVVTHHWERCSLDYNLAPLPFTAHNCPRWCKSGWTIIFFMACVVPYSGKATYGTNNINEPTCPKRK